jgi:GTPase SAR1 family protein
MTSAFYGKAQGVVVTFDISHRDSFMAIDSWLRDIRQVVMSYSKTSES